MMLEGRPMRWLEGMIDNETKHNNIIIILSSNLLISADVVTENKKNSYTNTKSGLHIFNSLFNI